MDEIRYFGTFDADGYPTGFYPTDVWPQTPDIAVEITEVQWRRLVKGGAKYIDGKVVDAPAKPLADQPEEP